MKYSKNDPRFRSKNGKYGPEKHFRLLYFYRILSRLMFQFLNRLMFKLKYLSIHLFLLGFL